MKRRGFIVALGGAAVLPLAAHAQRSERVRRIGVLMLYVEFDPAGQDRASAFRETLAQLGWVIGRNLEIDFHWGIGDAIWIRSAAAELLRRSPDMVVANGGQTVQPMQNATRTVPIVFIGGSDPVAEGDVQSLARPGGNVTGFTVLEPSHGAKLVSLLKEAAPGTGRMAIIFNPANAGARRLSDAAVNAARTIGVEMLAAPALQPEEIQCHENLAATAGSGLSCRRTPTSTLIER